MSWTPISELAADVKAGKVSAVDLVKKSLDIYEKTKDYNAILTLNEDALEQAKEVDKRISAGEDVGVLAGIPYVAKDNFLTKGVETTAASNILKGFIPPFSSTAVNKLDQAGAILLAKANLDSFAHGSSTENSDFEVTKNPIDKDYVPGGSSGGSAAAVALGMVPFAIGTDTGGSIRLPASFTGTVGLKPTYGLVSRYGVVAMASSTDVIGPITNRVDDAALVLDVMAGRDKLDSTTIERDRFSYFDLAKELKGKKFGLIAEHMSSGVQKEVLEATQKTADLITKAGGQVSEISLKNIDASLAVYYIVMPAEVSSNLSRYDGIRYGYASDKGGDLDEFYEDTRSAGFNDEVKRRILIGTYVLSSGYYDAYYKKAQQVRSLLINEFNEAFEKVDYLIGPTSPTTAFKIGQNTDDPLKMYLADIMTVATNLVGIPGISIPVAKDGKLPIGFQIMAKQRRDRELLSVAAGIETEVNYS